MNRASASSPDPIEAARRLVARCARVNPSPADLVEIRRLSRLADWDEAVRQAQRHSLVPLLHRATALAGIRCIPRPAAAALAQGAMRSAGHSLRLAGELTRLSAALQARGIRALAFKGPALGALAWGSAALRTCNDLDLLVARRDVADAADLLARMRFEPWNVSPAMRPAFLRSECEHAFHRGDGISVDLHWALSRRHFPFRLDFEGLWRRSRRVALLPGRDPDASVATLGPGDALLVACMHGAKHCWHRLAWVCDVAELLRQDLDWPPLLDRARGVGGMRMLLLGLRLARDLLGTPIPASLRGEAGDADAAALARDVRRRLFLPSAEPDSLSAAIRESVFHLRVRDRACDRLRYCLLGAAPTPRDFHNAGLPASLRFLCCLTRPARLVARHWPRHSAA